MIKNIQTKIILIFFTLGIIVIGALSFFHISMLEKNDKLLTNVIQDEEVLSLL